MDFKKISLKSILWMGLVFFLFIGGAVWKFMHNADPVSLENTAVFPPIRGGSDQEIGVKPNIQVSNILSDTAKQEDAAIQEQLDHDRKEQRQTKDLKIKLEQTNLELEQEKALAEINKLKKENVGVFSEPVVGVQNNLPEIKVDYIGGDMAQKEAILSIGGVSYQVKEKASPVANMQVVAISDSGVTLHFSTPEEVTKTIDYKPE